MHYSMKGLVMRWIAVPAFRAACMVASATTAEAQDYRFAAAYNAGAAYFTPFNGGASGPDGSLASEISLDAGWIVGLQFEQWLGSGRTGWRINGALTERPVALPGGSRDVGLWFADFDLLLRLFPATPDRRVNAALSLGAGMVRYKLGDGDPLFFESANASYAGDDDVRFVGAGGLSVDVLTSWLWDGDPVGIRIEIMDHVALDSPFKPISGSDFDPIHNVRLVIGAFAGWGILR